MDEASQNLEFLQMQAALALAERRLKRSEIAREADEGPAAPLADLPDGISPAANALTIRRMLDGSLRTPGAILDQVEILEGLARNR